MQMKNMSKTAIIYAILAAALYAVNIPLSKLLLNNIPPTLMAGFLYLGAGIGMSLLSIIHKEKNETQKLTKAELPYTLGMIVLDIAAPIFLMFGLTMTNSANASLLNNFEIVATSIIALVCFKEIISPKLWTAILFITVSTIILSFEDMSAFTFSKGSLLILCACVCWGFENNCTRKLSSKSSTEIVVLKGLFSGMGSLIIGLVIRESLPNIKFILITLILGFVSYGLSIKFYIMAQKYLGAAKTSAYYAISPFLAVIFSFALFGTAIEINFYIALVLMIIGTVLVTHDTIKLQHSHEHIHIHTHMHTHSNGVTHCHEHSHTHSHLHVHNSNAEEHSHTHKIENLPIHNHIHTV